MISRAVRTAAAMLALSLVLAACGGGGSSSGASFNDADVTFAHGMIPHHEQAIEMAEMALDPAAGASAAVRDLATKIKAGQDPEIQQMTKLLKSWGKPVTMDMSDGHDMGSMEGMVSDAAMRSMRATKGSAFDQQWTSAMIAHHEGAVSMAKKVQKDGKNSEIDTLAGAIIKAQEAEIQTMRTMAK